jgi:hypothetical protein
MLTRCSEPLNLALLQLSCATTGASGGRQPPVAEEIQLRTASALPLQEVQGGDLALDLPMTGGPLERGLHRGLLAW